MRVVLVSVMSIVASVAAGAVEIPAGTALSVRQQVAVGTRFSKVGDPVTAKLLAPILDQGRTILPAGSEVKGRVAFVNPVRLGFKHQNASLVLDFQTLRLPSGEELSIGVRVKRVETAREWVDPEGRIQGIGPVMSISSSLAVNAWRLMVIAPGVGASIWATKVLFAPAPDTEITFAPGTEYRLELVRPLTVADTDFSFPGRPASFLSRGIRDEVDSVIDSLPSQHAQRVSGKSADLLNLVFIGTNDDVMRAFQAAGWSTSDPKSTTSIVRTYFSMALRQGYGKAPMATMMLDGNRSDFELQKSMNSIAKRHHLRMWRRPSAAQGESVWVAAATEDTGIKFSKRAHNFTHVIDGNVDVERTKVVDDLLYTGCVAEAGFIERSRLPEGLENGTGTKLTTDGRVAVLRMNDCAAPRVMPGVGIVTRTKVLPRVGASLRSELIRSNFVSLAYNAVSQTPATRRFLFGTPVSEDTGATLTRQQTAWLAEKDEDICVQCTSAPIASIEGSVCRETDGWWQSNGSLLPRSALSSSKLVP